MSISRVSQCLLISVFASLFSLSTALCAQPASDTTVIGSGASPDVRVIIDISGSMKQNDPQNLRRPALELLVQLFPPGSKAGVWTFGQWVNNLVPSREVDQQWRDAALAQAPKINSVALHTNIPAALLKAVDDIDKLDPNYQVHLILLTDGMVDVSKSPAENAQARSQVIDEILPRLRAAGVTVHTVALSQNADQELMERLAVETGGLAAVAETAEDLTNIFLQAFDAAVPAEQVPLEGNAFLVDSSIEEFTALIFRKPGSKAATLIAPNKQQYSLEKHSVDVKWHQQDNYDLITVKSPYEGQWTINADLEPNSRVTIVSNLSLQIQPLAKASFIGDELEVVAALAEQGKTITRPEFLNLIDVFVEVNRRDDGEQWQLSLSEIDPIPFDGRFISQLKMLDQVGVYDVAVHADAKTFQRQLKQTIAVREAFDVRSRSSQDDIPVHTVSIFARNADIDSSNTLVVAKLLLPDGSQQEISLPVSADRRWQLEIPGVAQSGYYTISFEINGNYTNGESFSATTKPYEIEHQVLGSAMVRTPAQPVVDEAEEAEQPEEEKPEPEAAEPAAEPEPPEEEATPAEEGGIDWGQMALYAGIGLGNILVLVLGFLAYKAVSSSPDKSQLIDEDEDEDDLDDDEDDDIDNEDDDDDEDLEDDEPVAVAAIPVPEPEPEPEPEPVEDIDAAEDENVDAAEVDIDIEDIDIEEADADIDIEEVDIDEEGGLETESLDDLDDILDLPDDAIDIDPGSEEK